MNIHEAIARAAHGNRDVQWEQLSEAARQDWMERVRLIAEMEAKRMKPIIFSGPMVRALLEGRKTMTRRVLKKQPELLNNGMWVWPSGPRYETQLSEENLPAFLAQRASSYAVGDRLYVRETFCIGGEEPPWRTCFRATEGSDADCWKPSIHMPREASRITLTVVAVKVERLQDISEEDAKAEGIEKVFYEGPETNFQGAFGWKDYRDHPHAVIPYAKARESFQTLWQSLNAKRAPWDSNPWVVAITFKVHKCNIDRIPISNEAERRVKELLEPEAA